MTFPITHWYALDVSNSSPSMHIDLFGVTITVGTVSKINLIAM